jgi:MtfA peptidase
MLAVLAAFRRWRRAQIMHANRIDDDLWRQVIDEVAMLRTLSDDECARLRELTTLFVYYKRFFGAPGMIVDAHARTSIAAQACLPILNLGFEWYEGWRTVIVYESAFVARHDYVDEDGLVHEHEGVLEGETSHDGAVILSWEDVERGYLGYGVDDFPGNVVIHELAHKLDYRNGEANGFPPLQAPQSADVWANRFTTAYDRFCDTVDAGKQTAIDEYAAENPAEFFAVTSEMFFVAPHVLTGEMPEIYEQLALFYRQDPRSRMS